MHAADRFLLLAWAGEREHVLRVIEALRAADYDEAACRHIVAIVRPPNRVDLSDMLPPGAIIIDNTQTIAPPPEELIARVAVLDRGRPAYCFAPDGGLCCECHKAHSSMACCVHDEPAEPR